MNNVVQQFQALEHWIQSGILGLAAVIGLLLIFLLVEIIRGRRRTRIRQRVDTDQGLHEEEETRIYDTNEREALHRELEITDLEEEGPVFCQHCGTENLWDATYCQGCGVAMDMTLARHQLGWREGQVILSVGRTARNTIALHDVMVSKSHAQFSFGRGTLTVQDTGSSNGTYINDRRISEPVMVVRGDRLRFGKTVMSFNQIITVLSREIGQRKQSCRDGGGR